MKGQYMAVETVFTFGLGIMIATASLTIFQGIENNFLENGEDEQVDIIFSKVKNSLNLIRTVDNKRADSNITYELTMPGEVGGNEYAAEFEGNNLTINVDSKTYTKKISHDKKYSISGSFQGGSVTVIKNQNQIIYGNS